MQSRSAPTRRYKVSTVRLLVAAALCGTAVFTTTTTAATPAQAATLFRAIYSPPNHQPIPPYRDSRACNDAGRRFYNQHWFFLPGPGGQWRSLTGWSCQGSGGRTLYVGLTR